MNTCYEAKAMAGSAIRSAKHQEIDNALNRLENIVDALEEFGNRLTCSGVNGDGQIATPKPVPSLADVLNNTSVILDEQTKRIESILSGMKSVLY